MDKRIRIVGINGTSGNEEEDLEFRQALRIIAAQDGYRSIKHLMLAMLAQRYEDLAPYVENQLSRSPRSLPREEAAYESET